MEEKSKSTHLKNSNTEIQINPTLDTLIQFSSEKEEASDSPYKQSLAALEQMEQESETTEQFMERMIRDIIFTALYTTIYEELFSTLRVHKDVGLALIQKFSEDTKDRDNMVNIHTHNHIDYLFKGGFCDGCASCEGHDDVAGLIPAIKKNDTNYFIKLYLEVQTIYVAMEQVLYELIPTKPSLMDGLSNQVIDRYRNVIASSVQERLGEI